MENLQDRCRVRQEIVLDNTLPIRGIGELQTENLSVLFGLLKAIPRIGVDCLGLDHRNRKIAAVAEEVVSALLWPPLYFGAGDHNTAICKASLLAYLFVRPACGVEFRQDVATAGIRFSEKGHRKNLPLRQR